MNGTPVLASLLASGAGGMLIVSGIGKYGDRQRFERALLANPLTRTSAGLLSGAVMPLEIAVGVLLLVGDSIRLGAAAAGLLFAGFFAFQARHPDEDCGCGPLLPARRNARLVLTALFSAALGWQAWADPALARGPRLVLLSSLGVLWLAAAAVRESQRRRRDLARWARQAGAVPS